MGIRRILVANRGEIAIRILRAANELDIATTAVYAPDDARSLHVARADNSHALTGRGVAAYLDIGAVVAAARANSCDAVHPGYGFLAENPRFAAALEAAGITFIGPDATTLELFGDKLRAREFATQCDVAVPAGTSGAIDAGSAHAFLRQCGSGAMIIKAVAGGGGRGMRVVQSANDIEEALARCTSEARAAFGDGRLYAEELLTDARHIEVQIVGDGAHVCHVWERECTLQRRHQKLVEVAPSPSLYDATRTAILDAAVKIAAAARYRSLGTLEFLVDGALGRSPRIVFIEANPRLQVEHTVTEEVTGIDLVKAQIRIAAGATLEQVGLTRAAIPKPRGFALQARVNMETMTEAGDARPAGGTLTAFAPPGGPGVRVDTFGYAGYTTSPNYDSLLAKVIVHSASDAFPDALTRARRALGEFSIGGVATNLSFLRALLSNDDVVANRISTRFIEQHAGALARAAAAAAQPVLPGAGARSTGFAGARVDSGDPLAVLAHGKSEETTNEAAGEDAFVPEGSVALRAPLQGTIIAVDVEAGTAVRKGQQLLVMEAMKMEHVIVAPVSGIVESLSVTPGDAVFEGRVLALLTVADTGDHVGEDAADVDLDAIRADLAETLERHAIGLDDRRPDSVARRRKTGHRTTRENIDDLVDPGSFIEYGPLVVAAQRRRRTMQDLIEKTPADGMVAGVGSVNGNLFDETHARCAVLSYDYTVLAGTQGAQNHRKKDRLFEIAQHSRLPIVFFTEGGGGRPGDTDGLGVAGLDVMAFKYFGGLSGLVPLIGITSGRCFAGNAVLLGCCDVVIATEGSNIGIGGPAMIEGGGLGVFRPEAVGPMSVQVPNGVVDIAVKDEVEAVAVAKQYLSYFQGAVKDWACADQRLLRSAIPENRLRVYDVRKVIETIADTSSVLEIRRGFGHGIVTSFIRIEGRPVGMIANNPTHLAGAIDSPGADKAARFMQLCDAFDIPLLFLCDCPGIMVGPEIEKTALVRHASRMFVTGSSVTVPFFTIVLRKSYGLGAQAMAGGSFKAPFFAVSWPTGEFGGMGLEGAVKLGYRNELAAIEDPEQRKATYEEMVARSYERGKGVNVASHFEIDDVIDPMESRRWVVAGLKASPPPPPRTGKKRPCVDTW
jgi:acetyl/propionyl-CoA carboxylase alpha subunit/acetyl-CoA carboxylase carboxyltransferase component